MINNKSQRGSGDIIALLVLIFIVFTIVMAIKSGMAYEEGNSKAEEAFAKMSPAELSIYRVMEGDWHDNYFTPIRTAIAERPDDYVSKIPFCDVADAMVIIDNKINKHSCWSNGTCNNDFKFKDVDPNWWTRLKTECYSGNGVTIESAVENKPDPTSDKVVVGDKELLPYKEILMIQQEAKDCETASDTLRNIFNEQGYLTVNDRNKVMTEVSKCQHLKLNYQLNYGE